MLSILITYQQPEFEQQAMAVVQAINWVLPSGFLEDVECNLEYSPHAIAALVVLVERRDEEGTIRPEYNEQLLAVEFTIQGILTRHAPHLAPKIELKMGDKPVDME